MDGPLHLRRWSRIRNQTIRVRVKVRVTVRVSVRVKVKV